MINKQLNEKHVVDSGMGFCESTVCCYQFISYFILFLIRVLKSYKKNFSQKNANNAFKSRKILSRGIWGF